MLCRGVDRCVLRAAGAPGWMAGGKKHEGNNKTMQYRNSKKGQLAQVLEIQELPAIISCKHLLLPGW